jgi:hypothetical protein
MVGVFLFNLFLLLILGVMAGDAMAWIGTNLHQLWNFGSALILRLPAASIKYTACWWIYWAR